MFATASNSRLAQRTLDALRLTRSFLLLEDDYEVDWEVDVEDEPVAHEHPHRVWLRGVGGRSRTSRARRGGTVAPTRAVCTSPVGPGEAAGEARANRGCAPLQDECRSSIASAARPTG